MTILETTEEEREHFRRTNDFVGGMSAKALAADLDKALEFIEELSKQPYLDRYAARFEAFKR
jgi:hypothetical protein